MPTFTLIVGNLLGASLAPRFLHPTSGPRELSVREAGRRWSDGVDARNRASADRLTALGERLSDDELRTEIDPPWTAAGLFARIAFGDRLVLERWRLAAERGERTPMAVDGGLMDRINDASLRQWMSIPPRAAVEECATSASDVDAFVEDVADDVREELAAEGRERLVDRSLHRGDHLGTLEAAFPAD